MEWKSSGTFQKHQLRYVRAEAAAVAENGRFAG
jgi:hypothetical protein